MKLKKINKEHYVVVDETIQPVNGYYYDFLINKIKSTNGAEYGEASHCWQITHSTKVAIEDYWNVIELPLSEVKELIGVVDVEKKAHAAAGYPKNEGDREKFYIKGYTQALEDNKDKKYTEEDLRKAFFNGGNMKEIEEFNSFIQSLQPKTEWEVEFINGKLTLKQ